MSSRLFRAALNVLREKPAAAAISRMVGTRFSRMMDKANPGGLHSSANAGFLRLTMAPPVLEASGWARR